MSFVHSKLPQRRGFTLVELMVGILLAMLTTVVISQVLAMAEGHKRNTTSGNDAQVSGALALFTFQRDIQMAGYGIASNPAALGCSVQYQSDADKKFVLAPVVITDGGNKGEPDSITILMSNSNNASMPMKLEAAHGATDASFTVGGVLGISAGDLIIAIPKAYDATTHCSLLEVSNDPGGAASQKLSTTNIPHKSAPSGVLPAGGFDTDAYVVNMGSVTYRTYSVSAQQMLQMGTTSLTTGTVTQQDLYPQVVDLQAFYGMDTTGDGKVDSFTSTTPTTAAGWESVKTIRLAIVTRNSEYQQDEVTTSDLLWNVGNDAPVTGSTACGDSKCIALKLDTLTDWKHYRYRVYDTVIPLRNVLWNS